MTEGHELAPCDDTVELSSAVPNCPSGTMKRCLDAPW
jgi:hypothetical protein